MIQRAGKFANDEKWGERSWYGRDAFKWWKALENTIFIEEKRWNDEKRGKTQLLLKRSVEKTKSPVKRHSYWKEAFKWWWVQGNTTVIEGKLSNDGKREKEPLLLLKSARKVKRTVPAKAHEERQNTFDKFALVPHWLKFVNLFWRISSMLRNDLSLQGRKPA